jgi:hypothetical protein
MVCTACGRPIVEGQFRYRETEEAYLPQHRACSKEDKRWTQLDSERAKREEFDRLRREAFAIYCDKFGVPDDLIEEMRG